MNILILTTNTPHHTYFTKELISKFKNIFVICEKKKIKFKYKTYHLFEKKRDKFEIKKWFKNKNHQLTKSKNIIFVKDLNSLNLKNILKNKLDLILVFGTSVLSRKFLQNINCPILNFHGGNPEKFRGLDSHLWAILDHKINELKVTIHKLKPEIDRGDILYLRKIKLKKNMKIYEIRKQTTEICLNLAIKTINAIANKKKLLFKKQKKIGKYYSAMNTHLKGKCEKIFNRYTSNL